jgi:Zn-dependent M16 (insulinase) family peptidase
VPFYSTESGGEISTTVNWVLNETHMTPREQLAWDVLDHLLMYVPISCHFRLLHCIILFYFIRGTSASVLRKALTDSALGSSVVGGGMDDTLMQSTFSVGLKGVTSIEDREKMERLIFTTLEKMAQDVSKPTYVFTDFNIRILPVSLKHFF